MALKPQRHHMFGFSLFLLTVAICYLIGIPRSSSVSLVTIEAESSNYTNLIGKLKEKLINPSNLFDVYVITTRYMIKPEETKVFVPYIVSDIENVPKASVAEWKIKLCYVAYQWDGKSLAESRDITLGETRFIITAAPNTLLRLYNSEFSNPLEVNVHSKEWKEDSHYSEVIRVATVDSDGPRNDLSKASVIWEGEILIGKNFLQSISQDFYVNKEIEYYNNC